MKHRGIFIAASSVCLISGLLFATLPSRNQSDRAGTVMPPPVMPPPAMPTFEPAAAAPPALSAAATAAAAAGNATLSDLQFKPVQGQHPFSINPLEFRFEKGRLTLYDTRAKSAVWSGDAADANFTEETEAGVHTLKDSSGKTIWSDAADTSVPDLLLQKYSDGQARLLDKSGSTLWTGSLGAYSKGTGSRSSQRGNTIVIEAGGIRIKGENGSFRVSRIEGDVALWTGTLPASPIVLIREGYNYALQSPGRGESGRDKTVRLRFVAEGGTAVVSNTKNKVLGTVPVDLLKITQETMWRQHADDPKIGFAPSPHVQIQTQMATLTANGALLITYQDSTGRAFQRAEVYKAGRGSSFISHGM